MGLSDAPDFNLKAIYESNRRQGVQKSQGREKRLIMQEVVLNPGSPHTIQFLKAVYGLIRG